MTLDHGDGILLIALHLVRPDTVTACEHAGRSKSLNPQMRLGAMTKAGVLDKQTRSQVGSCPAGNYPTASTQIALSVWALPIFGEKRGKIL